MKNTRKNERKVTLKEFRQLLYFYRGAELALTTLLLLTSVAFIIYDTYFSFFISTNHYDDGRIMWTIIPIIICFVIPIILKIIDIYLENKYTVRRKKSIEKAYKENKQLADFRDQIEKDLEGVDFGVIFVNDEKMER